FFLRIISLLHHLGCLVMLAIRGVAAYTLWDVLMAKIPYFYTVTFMPQAVATWLKLDKNTVNIGQGNWEATTRWFHITYPSPYVSADTLAMMCTTLEALLVSLLVLGLGVRLAAASLLVLMT